MEASMGVEKGIGLYLLFLSGVEIGLFWLVGCFVTLEFLTVDQQSLGLYSGLIPMAFTIGKLSGHKFTSYITVNYNIKWVLSSLHLASALSIMAFGLMSSFIPVLCCRFISGFCSNSQFATRKFLIAIESQQKSSWPNLSHNALWSHRLGNAFGIAAGAFLTSCKDFLPDESKFVEKKFLLCSLITFLLQLSGVLMLVSIDTKNYVSLKPVEKYVELPELKDQKDGDNEESESVNKEKSDFVKYLQASGLANENCVSEESVEEVKFYSPRNFANKDLGARRLNSARPKVEGAFHFSEASHETKEIERPEGDGKRTHISFIEEELDSIPELQKSECNQDVVESEEKDHGQESLRFAGRFRLGITLFCSLVTESLPFWMLGYSGLKSVYVIGAVVLAIYICTGLGHLLLFPKLLMRFSYYKNIGLALWIEALCLLLLPLLVYVNCPVGLIIIIWIAVLCCNEVLLPTGTIMISESTQLSNREAELGKSDIHCISIKALACYISPMFLYLLGTSNISLALYSLSFILLLITSRKIPENYPNLIEVPYKL